jgi:serine/threonine protein kinase
VECPKKILHRDISVNNILLPNEDSPPVGHRGFLIDFDYAKSLADESNDDKTLEPASGAADDSSDLDGSSASKHSEASKHRQRTVCAL